MVRTMAVLSLLVLLISPVALAEEPGRSPGNGSVSVHETIVTQERTRTVDIALTGPFDFPRPSKNQERPNKVRSFACDRTCYCNVHCVPGGQWPNGTICVAGGSDKCRNGLYCELCEENCIPTNPCS